MATEKLLVTTANQTQQFLLQLADEQRKIRTIAASYADVQDLTNLDYPSLWNLLNSPTGQTITMVHYIGHSSPQGLYVLGNDGHERLLASQDITDLFGQAARHLRFIFLNSCRSEEVAQALLRAGVPYVVGTSVAIRDDQAVQVADRFYRILGNIDNSGTTNVDVDQSPTMEEAFRQTKAYLEGLPNNPFATQADSSGGGFATDSEEDKEPWKLYSHPDLTESQRTWRLVTPKPLEASELYSITPQSASFRPFSFFLSYTAADQAVATELVARIGQAFEGIASLQQTWTDASLTDSVPDREQQLADHLQQTDFVFMLVNNAYLTNSITQKLVSLAQARKASGSLLFRPIVFPTEHCPWQNSAAKAFDCFPRDGGLFSIDEAGTFGNTLYEGWKTWRKNQLAAR